MATTPFKDFPDNQPAPHDHVADRDGAVSSSSNGGPMGKRGAVRGGAAPRTTSCERCGGVFSEAVDELAYHRRDDHCKTCGADAHWESAAIRVRPWDGPDRPLVLYEPGAAALGLWDSWHLPPQPRPNDFGGRDRWRENPRLTGNARGFRDLDRTWLTAEEMLEETLGGLEPEPLEAIFGGDVVDVDGTPIFGGSLIEKVGATGQRVGPPKKGQRGDHLEQALQDLYTNPGYCLFVWDLAAKDPDGTILSDSTGVKLSRQHLTRVRRAVVRHVPNANTQALADHFGITSRAVRLLKAVRSANSPTSEETKEGDMSTTDIERLETVVREEAAAGRALSRAQHEELFRVLWAFRHGETPVEAWERLLADDEAA